MKKVIIVFGTRPEAIKMCPVIQELKKIDSIECKVCLTGQHKEMLSQVMDVFNINVDYNLEIMKENQSLSSITTDILTKMNEIFINENPDLILVHGDTSTSFAVALSAFYNQICIGHVEAGLRTYNLKSPYPEEFNRQVVDIMADMYFAPTEEARKNLLSEGKDEKKIFVTGNTVIDALNTTVSDSYTNEHLQWADGSRLILLTAHRRENIGEPMKNIFRAVRRLAESDINVKVIYPIHKNPKVRRIAEEIFEGCLRVKLIEPLDVFDFHNFMKRSYLIMTDSGGIQEEAPSLGKPVLVLRDTTERPEGIKAGTLKLVGTEEDIIYEEATKLLTNNTAYQKMCKAINPYGDGHASKKITKVIIDYLKEKK